MFSGIPHIKKPQNEPIHDYVAGSAEREDLSKELEKIYSSQIEIPLIIGGKEIFTGKTSKCVLPHDHKKVIGIYHEATEKEIELAVSEAKKAWKSWSEISWDERAAIFMKAADILTGPKRNFFNAVAMADLSKSVFQAEIDIVCELADFFRFNAYFMQEIISTQPESAPGTFNKLDYRPLEGFVFAVTPFNFASIAGNLPTSPAMLGNTVIWKPASSAVYSSYQLMKLLVEAGLPEGVINFVPGPGRTMGEIILKNPNLAGIHFTGSTPTFQSMWKTVGDNIASYRSYPRIVGETGGKDFVFVHKSSDAQEVVTALIRGAFEFQGQKCSAASRAYIPASLWTDVKAGLIKDLSRVKMGDPKDFTNFVNAVIDESSFNKIMEYVNRAKEDSECTIISGGKGDSSKGYFIEPTVVEVSNPGHLLMNEEIFGPVLTIFVYQDDHYVQTLEICDQTSPYALTGSIFAKDKEARLTAVSKLRHCAGNFYINDKPTGAVVNQQPFGGGRASGTNDKAGSTYNLTRWISLRNIKENFVPPRNFEYPFMK
ncbi:L-glutamate gamma-semialdehyde dehydrogenase [Myxococcota bacterium]|nr:L-glutamate gamma-semialdehyde dehydrogenase [Myxococcota bacterium]MBU1380003.1 L-glutamate gamma-semialdehyde dehydrogenase [Myxococcota bacterium]MBU1496760.1 L-glutamate gamma-semialdehyde dehydrogenase [Myxococcota bacterium]